MNKPTQTALQISTRLAPICDLPYAPSPHERQVGDLFLSGDANANSRSTVLLVHGGGWDAMSKEAMNPIARFFVDSGFHVYNINYRLLQHAIWPACRDDVVTAGRFVTTGGLAAHGIAAGGKLIVIGASAGGHLAMTGGLALPVGSVQAILSAAGPADVSRTLPASTSSVYQPGFWQRFFGTPSPTPAMLNDADVVQRVALHPAPPTLYCIHSKNDQLVLLSESEKAVAGWKRRGATAELLTYNGHGDSHAIFDSVDVATRSLVPDMARLLEQTAERLSLTDVTPM